MTGRRSRSVRNLALAALLASACAGGFDPARPRYLLESPPASKDLVGRLGVHETSSEDTLIDLAPELGVGYVELLAANPGIDPWLPPDDALLFVPNARLLPDAPRDGIVVNLGDLRLYYYEKGAAVRAYPIGIAKDGYATPMGVTSVKAKREKPDWIPGESARRDDPSLPARVKPGPDNPLGEHALYLAWPSYLIHGTNDPRGVGRHSSRGCIRLYPEHIAELYERVEPGTAVRVVNQPVKLGWIGGELYLEVNPDSEQSLQLDETGKLGEASASSTLRGQVTQAAGKQAKRVDWALVERIALRRTGIPARVTR
ncbi:MAG: L,D-transpeptidase family protein [Candidatus Limnocylindria bacterium]|jgi:L,D-transpeptidase ErfK/SrfK